MYRNILRRINVAIYLLIVIAIATLQSTIFGYFPLNYFQPDLLLILAVYFGLKRETLEGGILVIISALILEAHSSAGQYFFLTTYLYAFLIAKIVSKILVVPSTLASMGLVSALTVLKRIGILLLLGLQNRAENGVQHFLIYLVPGVLIQAALTPIIFMWFTKIDLRTYKDEHSEDEYDINR